MGMQLAPILEGVTVGFLAAVVLLLICIIIIKRRRELQRLKADKSYSSLDHDPCADNFLAKNRDWGSSSIASTKLTTIQPVRGVTWAVPVSEEEEERKPRSSSCPVRRNAMVDITDKPEESPEASLTPATAETPATKGRKSRKYKRSKTDSCYHACQIQFTVYYNHYHSTLTLQLVCAVNIPSTFGVNYGSYIEVELLPSSDRAATNVQFHTNKPVFNESVDFPGITPDELLNMSLILRLYTVDRFSHSNLVGRVTAPFVELDINPTKPTTIWRPITACGDSQSRISSSLTSLKDIVDKGELTISLKYQILSNKITVLVMKASNLPNISKIFALDPYVVVKLLLNLKTVQTKKTSIKRRTTSPCWNEPLAFELDSKIPISEYSMSFKVKSHNSLSEDPTIGEIEVGYHASSTGREHWKGMILKKNQDRAQSHKIK